MQEMSRSGTAGELRLDALIADLWWRVRLLNTDILEEESKAGVFDVHQPTYPLLALNLRARRDNLVSTIGVLEQRAKSVSEAAAGRWGALLALWSAGGFGDAGGSKEDAGLRCRFSRAVDNSRSSVSFTGSGFRS